LSRGFDPASCPTQPLGSYHLNYAQNGPRMRMVHVI